MIPSQSEQRRWSWVLCGLLVLASGLLSMSGWAAPASLELFAGGGNTSATGPTLADHTNTFALNSNNPSDNVNVAFNPTTTATLSLTNQQYSSSNYTTTGAPGGNAMMFGGEGNSYSDQVAAATIYVPLNTKGGPPDSVFTATVNTPAGQGISGSANYGTRFFVSTEPLQRSGKSTTGRYYMGDIVVTFNRPLLQPVLQIGGLGGTSSSGLGFSAEFDVATAGVTLAELSGSSELSVSSTQIKNGATQLGATTGSGGASGSVVLNSGGTPIQTVTFKVYIRGDGTGNYWDGSGSQNGDAFVFSVGSLDAGMDLTAAKSQRAGTSGTFVTSPVTVPLSNVIQYQLVLTNTGPQYVTSATYTDALPAALTNPSVVSTTAAGGASCGSPTFSGNTLSGTLTGPVNASCTVIIQATGAVNADITNTVTVVPPSGITDLNTSNNSASVSTRMGSGSPQTDVRTSKTDGLDSIAQGSTDTYTIRVTNFGANPVTGVVLTDPATTGLTKTGTPACSAAIGNTCSTASLPTVAQLESASGYALPTLAANGGFYEITVKATVGTVSSITNTSSVNVTPAGYVNSGASCTSNNGIIRSFSAGICSSTDTTTVLASNSMSFDSAIKEARLSISPDVPTIWRGGTGTQIVTITNNGPDTANNAFATYTESLQTGVSISTVTLPGGSTCPVSGTSPSRVWTCPLGTLANGSSASFLVNYGTTTAASLGNNQIEGVVRAGSDEFNPGSGVGESVYRIWGAEGQQTTPSKYGAFMVGYTGMGGLVDGSGNGKFGTYSYEGTSIVGAWPTSQASPTGGYLNFGIAGTNSSNYMASSSINPATIQRLTTTLSNLSVSLPREDNASNMTDNRRAWELKTGVLIPASSGTQTYTLCIGNSSQKIDDSAYIMVNGVVQGSARDTWVNTVYNVSVTMSPGYNVITYRIANRNSTSGDGGEVNAGGFGTIGMNTGSVCAPDGLNAISKVGENARINIIDAAALVITKTNSTSQVNASGQTTYTLTVENQGPSTVTGAILRDPVASNMTKGAPVCSTIGNNQCSTPPTAAQLEAAGGFALPTLTSGQKYILNVPVTLGASSVASVSNTASVRVPAGVTGLGSACVNDTTNGYVRTYDSSTGTCSTTDTDSVAARVVLQKTSSGGVGSFAFSLTNADPADESLITTTAGTAVTGSVVHAVTAMDQDVSITEASQPGYVLTGASCTDSNASLTGNPTGALGTLSGNVLTIPADNVKPGASFVCSFTNGKLPTLSLSKVANGGNDTFGFALTNTQQASGSVTTTTPGNAAQVDADTATAGMQDFAVAALNTDITIQENTLPAGWKLGTAICKSGGNTVGTLNASTGVYTIPAAQVTAGAAFSCTFTNNKTPVVRVQKITTGSAGGPFSFTQSNLAAAPPPITTMATGTATPATPAAIAVQTLNTDVVLTEAPASNFVLSTAQCTDANSSVTGNTGNLGSLSGNALTIPAANIRPGSDLTCVFTNRRTVTLTLAKTWNGAQTNDQAVVVLKRAGSQIDSLSSTASSASQTDMDPTPVTVYAGETLNLSETLGSSNTGLYTPTLDCGSGVTVAANGDFTVPASNLTCTVTNTRKARTLKLTKLLAPTTDNGTFNLLVNGSVVASAVGHNGTGSISIPVNATVSVNEQAAGTSVLANYSSSLSCTGVSGVSGTTSGSFAMPDDEVSCSFTNTRKTVTVTLKKAWSVAMPGDQATVLLKRAGTTVDSLASTVSLPNDATTDSSPYTAYVGETLNLSETLAAGNTGTYTAALACDTGTSVLGSGDFVVPASNVLCIVTNTRKFTQASITGLVFNDNSGTTGQASNAHDGTRQAGEQGLAGVLVRVTDCGSTLLGSGQTDASGNYAINVEQALLGTRFCIVETNPSGYVSVSGGVNGSGGYTRSTDTIQRTAISGQTSYPDNNFGDVDARVILTSDGQRTIAAGSSATYAHTLSVNTPLTVSLATSVDIQPTGGATWTQLTYLDSNCNGQVDSGETLLLGGLNLLPGNPVCLIDRVNSPLTAAASSQYLVSYIATGTASVQDGGTITASSAERRDLTLVGSPQGALLMEKKVRTVASCPSTGSDVASFVTSNTAKNGQRLEYQIIYRNAGNANLSQVVVRDSVPATTRFGSASCTSTPGGNSCSITQQPAAGGSGDLRWQMDGSIKPGQSGEVRFCVDLPALP